MSTGAMAVRGSTDHGSPGATSVGVTTCGSEALESGALGGGGLADDALLRAVSDPLRARIVALLAVEQLCTCHLVELTGARQTNVSNHLRVLREQGVVTASPAGRFTYYRLQPSAMRRLAEHFTALAVRADDAPQRRRPCD